MKQKISFYDRKMIIPVKNGTDARYYGDLMFVLFDKPDCILHFADGEKYKVEVALKHVMEHLPKGVFLKCKRSAILNLCHFKQFRKKPPMITMNDGAKFSLTKQNAQEFMLIIDQLTRFSPPCPICYTCRHENCKNRTLFCLPDNQNNEQMAK